jgi:Bacterial PH domain
MLLVETERLEIGNHQVVQLTLYAGVLTGVGVLLDILALSMPGHGPKKLVAYGIGLTIGGVIALWARTAYARAYTELTADGIATRGLFGTRRAAWADVRSISVFDYRGRGAYSVKVALHSGASFRLGAPVHSPVMADPAFSRKAERIIAVQQQALSGTAPGGGAIAG